MKNKETTIRMPKIIKKATWIFIILCALFISGDTVYRFYHTYVSTDSIPLNVFFSVVIILLIAAFAIYLVLTSVFHPNNIKECIPSPSLPRDPLVDRLNEFERAEQSSPELVAERPIFPDDSFCPYCKDKMERRESGGIVVASCRLCKRSFSNVGPVFIDGKIQIIKYSDASLKEMIPVPLE